MAFPSRNPALSEPRPFPSPLLRALEQAWEHFPMLSVGGKDRGGLLVEPHDTAGFQAAIAVGELYQLSQIESGQRAGTFFLRNELEAFDD